MQRALTLPLRWFTRKFDIRAGEGRVVAYAFTVLLLIIAAHTVLETARDALLLARLPAESLGIVYVGVAALTLPSAAFAARVSERLGARRGLAVTLLVAALITSVFFFVVPGELSVMVLYVVSGLIGAHLVPQFWALSARLFTVAEGKRLIGPIASAGVIGGILGSSLAGVALLVVPVRALTVVAALVFVIAAFVLASAALEERNAPRSDGPASPPISLRRAFEEQPFLRRIALLVVLSTATVLAIDYLFKWTVSSSVPADRLGLFFAIYYAALNGASFIVQLFVGGAVVRRMGVAFAAAVTPALLLFGGLTVLLVGGIAAGALVLRGVDGSLRHSIHRITTELVYFPVPAQARERVKPIIDGTFARLTQAATALMLLLLSHAGYLSLSSLSAIVVALSSLWLVAAGTLRRPYLALFRQGLSAGSLDVETAPAELDISSAELLVEQLASRDPAEVCAAMVVLARRGRERLIPALVLYHHDETVLVQALSIFGASNMAHWLPLAEPLLKHPREEVRIAAVRALATHGKVDIVQGLLDDMSSRVQGYAVLHLALQNREVSLLDHPRISVLLKQPGDIGAGERLGLLAAIADAPRNREIATLLLAMTADQTLRTSAEALDLMALAAARQRDPRLIDPMIGMLSTHAGRESARNALVELGDPAFNRLAALLDDRTIERRLRVHLPRTIARFGTHRAAALLFRQLENEPDGLVRYKALRGLGRIVSDRGIRVDRARTERLAHRNLLEHFRLLGLRGAVEGNAPASSMDPRRALAAGRLLAGLLDDKLRQSLDRAFRLLKIAYPREDIHAVYLATQSSDSRIRANAGEFLDTLLAQRAQESLRRLFRIVTDELDPAERVRRARAALPAPPPESRDEALLVLVDDNDVTLASLAAFYAAALGTDRLQRAVALARAKRPTLVEVAARLFELPMTNPEPTNV